MVGSPDGDDSPDEEPVLSLDAILDLLAHHHRRAMLQALRTTEDHPLPEGEIIDRLQESERERTGEQPSWDHMSASLHHIHNPKLSEAGLISYDEGESAYHYQPDERLEKWLDLIESEHESEL